MDNKAEIEAWRAGLPLAQRLKLNHPANVLARWQASKAKPKTDRSSPMTEAKAEIARLKLEIKRLRDKSGNSFTPTDTPKDIAEAVAAELLGASANKLEQTATAIADRLRVEAHRQRVQEDEQKARRCSDLRRRTKQ
jgi:hypothetical protein